MRQPIAKSRTYVATNKHRKYTVVPVASSSILSTLPLIDKVVTEGSLCGSDDSNKKPLIAVWKTGAKLQNTSPPSTVAQAENNG